MDSKEKRILKLERDLKSITERLKKLEGARDRPAAPAPRAEEPTRAAMSFVEQLMALRGENYEREGMRGAVAYAGAARFGDNQYCFIKQHGLPALFDSDLEEVSRVLSALSNPSRLAAIQALLEGPRTSQELQEALGISSPGQLYHHLKELQSSGLISHPRGGSYQIASHKVLPFLSILAAGIDLILDSPGSIDEDNISMTDE